MQLNLSDEDIGLVLSLAQPIDQRRRAEFMREVAQRLEAASAIGPGMVHRIARGVQREFWDPPRDLREGRAVPRF